MNIGNITSDNFNLDGNGKDIQIEVYEQLIEQLQQENQELKLELSGYRQAILEDKDMLGLKEENTELKKQLEYLRSGEYYNQLRFERDMLQDLVYNGKISKEDKKFIDMTHRNTELLEQQKEFIEYMNKTIEELECDDVGDEEMKGYLIQRIDTFKEILSKYKEIIGGNKDE